MKIDRLDAHDRLEHLQKDQSHVIAQGCDDCLKKNSLSLAIQARCHYVYIFAHPRTIGLDERIARFNEDLELSFLDLSYVRRYKTLEDVPDKVFIWQPRLSKPRSQTNSYLYRAKSNSDLIKICWFIPPRELWEQFKKGNVTESADVIWSIDQFMHNREKLEEPFPDDVSEERFKAIMYDIAKCMDEEKRMKTMPKTEELYPSSDSASYQKI